ncbi:MAG: alpha/beta hydrolase [Desulfobacteraceae bacterium]|jgi:triacylglycerol lipase|nr:alpha/beta hydrolase [Desulfobacteraceae bacterium]
MKKKFITVLSIVCVLILLIPATGFSAGNKTITCDTKYPVILAHGTGGAAKILGIIDYWWGIPDALENEGTEVYVTTVNGMDGTVTKAEQFKAQFLRIQAISSSSKFNIIAHSHGTLYARYAISNLELSPYVESLTSIAGPHQGMMLADIIVKEVPTPVQTITATTLNFIYAFILGDTNPDSLSNAYDVTTDYMQNVFNPNTLNVEKIYYQSWAAKIKYAAPTMVLDPVWRMLADCEGPNDGLVSVESAKWGNFRGVESAAWWSPGCDHLNIIGHLFGLTPGFNAPSFYVNIVADLKIRGL